MLREKLHVAYITALKQFIENSEYILKVNNKAKKPIILKKGDKIIAVVFTNEALQQTDDAIEKLEAAHQIDQRTNKDLKKENKALRARLELLEKLNNPNDKDFPFN